MRKHAAQHGIVDVPADESEPDTQPELMDVDELPDDLRGAMLGTEFEHRLVLQSSSTTENRLNAASSDVLCTRASHDCMCVYECVCVRVCAHHAGCRGFNALASNSYGGA